VSELKHAKYIVTDIKHDMKLPSYRVGALAAQKRPPEQSTRVMWVDNEVVPGAFYTECVWFLPGMESGKATVEPHHHSFNEVVAFFGTNTEDLHNLNGEVEFWLEDEKIVMTRNFLVFVPAGMKHGPLIIRRVDRPIFHFTIGTGQEYI
jgi:quercetin dioxygenase-like cupin family protein